MSDKTPAYDDLIDRIGGRGPSPLSLSIVAMKPGDVLDAGNESERGRVGQSIAGRKGYVRNHSPHKYVTRVRNGRVYVLCLRPEDVKNGKHS